MIDEITLLIILAVINNLSIVVLTIQISLQIKINKNNLEWRENQSRINKQVIKELEMNQVRYKLYQN